MKPVFSVALVLLATLPTTAEIRYNVADLGPLSVLGSAEDINDVGQVLLSYDYIWQDGRPLVRVPSGGLAINNLGHVVATNAGGVFFWSKEAGSVATVLNYGADINDFDQIAGSYERTSVIWQNGMLTFSLLGADDNNVNAQAINNAGQVAGHYTGTSFPRHRVYLWQGDQIQWLTAADQDARAVTINSFGDVAGALTSYESYDQMAFVWEDGRLTTLGTLGGRASVSSHINDHGQIVGASINSSFVNHAFLWDGTMRDLNNLIPTDSGWVLFQARSNNNSGQIVGSGIHNGVPSEFLLTPVPEPSVLLAFGLGLGGLMGAMRRRR